MKNDHLMINQEFMKLSVVTGSDAFQDACTSWLSLSIGNTP
jgi:hypothetical protein